MRRYGYDAEGRVSSYESACGADPEGCTHRHSFSYYDDGTLQKLSVLTDTGDWQGTNEYDYTPEGNLLLVHRGSTSSDDFFRYYEYRQDGQVAFGYNGGTREEAMAGMNPAVEYEYDDADRLSRVMGRDSDGYEERLNSYTYEFEGDLLRSVDAHNDEFSKFMVFDDFSREAVRILSLEGESDPAIFVLDGSMLLHAHGEQPSLAEPNIGPDAWHPDGDFFPWKHPQWSVDPERLLPRVPHELTNADVSDFHYESGVPWRSSYERKVGFDAEGRLQRLDFRWIEAPATYDLSIELKRCDGAVLETTRYPDPERDEDYAVYYYGCDDFELPEGG